MQKKNQKVIMVALLGIVMLSVGVWQWQSMSTPPQEPAQKEGEQPAAGTGQSEQPSGSEPPSSNHGSQPINTSNLAVLPVRDPFTPELSLIKNPDQSPPAGSNRIVISNAAPRTISGSLPPLSPMGMSPGNGVHLESTEPDVKPEPPTPDWQVMGVVQGPNTLAIVKDRDGNRRFVRQGESLGNGFRVESVRRGEIIVRGHGQKHTLKVGGNQEEQE